MVKLNKDQTLDALLLQQTKDFSISPGGKVGHKSVSRYHKPICPYISSTFIDLEDEFKHLHSEVFPSLNELCMKRGSYFSALDFRRTAIDNRSSSEYILKYALDKVVDSLPFFMCVMGSQYGPHRTPLSPPLAKKSSGALNTSSSDSVAIMDQNLLAACHDHPWIMENDFQLCSMMELEILLACFSSQNQFPKYCFFYIKECFRASQRTENDTFLETESEYTQERFSILKRHIVNKGLPVKFFATNQELGQAVQEDWSQVILSLFPLPSKDYLLGNESFNQHCAEQTLTTRLQHKYKKYPQLCELEEIFSQHCSPPSAHSTTASTNYSTFSWDEDLYSKDTESLAGYKIGDGIFSTAVSFVESLKSHMRSEPAETTHQNILALVGEPGSGKSSFLTNWLHNFKKNHSDMVIVSEFVGSSYLSQDVTAFLRRCIRILREKYFQTRSSPNEALADINSCEGLTETFASCLYLMPCVIVMDSINDLRRFFNKDIGSIKDLSWLPKKIPSTCKIILSTRKSDYSYKALQERNDVIFQWMPTISLEVREQIFESHFESPVAELVGRDHLEKIWLNRLSDKPLYLATLSDLLHFCRDSRDIDQVIDKCTALRMFRDFWKAVFVLWSRRYSWSKNSAGQPGSIRSRSRAVGWVADALKLISSSRCGLTRDEIIHLLSLIGYRGRATVTPNDWEMFRMAAGGALNTGNDGTIQISNEDARLALRNNLFLPMRNSPSRCTVSDVEGKHQHFHSLLGSYFLKFGSMARKLVELPWQLQQGKDWLMLCQVLCKPRFFLAMCRESLHKPDLYIDHISYWRDLIEHEFDVEHCMKAMIAQATQESDVALDSEKDLQPNLSSTTQPSASDSKQKQVSHLLAKGPSLIIVTQHEDPPMSIHQSTEESLKSETEDRDFNETDSSIFFLTEAEVDHHLLVAGWTPGEGNSEVLIDNSLLEIDEVAHLYHKVAWFLYQLGEEFFEKGRTSLDECYVLIESCRPLSSEQLLALLDATVTECRFSGRVDRKRLFEASDLYKSLTLQTMDISQVRRRGLVEASAELSLKMVELYIEETNFQEAHNLILDVFEESKACSSVCLKAQATCMFGKLLMSQGLFVQSEEMLTMAFTTFMKWSGKKRLAVGRVLEDLGQLFSVFLPRTRVNQRKAMLAYKQALEVFQFNKKYVEAAKVSSIIGQLLLHEGSFRSKKEASSCFEKSIDIYITKQAPNNLAVAQATRNYKQVTSDLKSGRFTHGKARPPDHRTTERPYSALTWHSHDLTKIGESEENVKQVYSDIKYKVLGKLTLANTQPAINLKKPPPSVISRPYSAFSTQSIGSYVLVTPRKSKKREMTSERLVREASALLSPLDNTKLKEFIKSEYFSEDQEFVSRPASRKMVEEYDALAAVASIKQMRPATSEGKEHPVIIVPGDRNSRMSEKVEEQYESVDRLLAPLPHPGSTSTRPETSTSKRSVRLHSTPVVSTWTRKQPVKHHCSYQSGSQHLSMTVHGPYSAVTDILLTPPSTRSSGRSTDVHHRSAWFHVPGRYVKPGEALPSKRSQKRPYSAATASAKSIYRYLPSSRSLPVSRQGGDRGSTYPASIMSGKSRATGITRRHSDFHLDENSKVAFDAPIDKTTNKSNEVTAMEGNDPLPKE